MNSLSLMIGNKDVNELAPYDAFRQTDTYLHRHTDIKTHRLIETKTLSRTDTQTLRHTDITTHILTPQRLNSMRLD